MTVANFIIGGTEKAGTTAVFSYLAQHPEVSASRKKETDFFRRSGQALSDYERYFPRTPRGRVVMEASPGYLGEAADVVPRMRAMIPGVKLLFILREPVARLLSSFHFHRERLNLPLDLTFEDYVDACLIHAEQPPARAARPPGLHEWHLKTLEFGCYATYLRWYLDAFPARQLKVAFHDDLRSDPRAFMEELSAFLEIDAAFWRNARLEPKNVTFRGRNRRIHRLAVAANARLEPILRPRPELKSLALKVYKRINGGGDGYTDMSPALRSRLERYYGPPNQELEHLLGRPLPDGWGIGNRVSGSPMHTSLRSRELRP